MKRISLLALLLLSVFISKAQLVSLNNSEIEGLKKLAATNVSAKARLSEWQRVADQSLTSTPNPIDTIHTEGRLKGDPQKTATSESLRDMHKMYALALTYRISGDKKYFTKAAEFLSAWARKNSPNGDPIDDTNLDPAVETYDFIKADLSADDNKLISSWLAATAQAEMDKIKRHKGTATNNWHSHRLKEVGEIGFAIGDKKYQQWAIDGLKEQIAKNLLPDGSSIDFKLRDALHYHVYDLEPLLKLSIILKRATGVDYYNYVSPEQTSIRKSVEWLLPYLNGQKTHGEFVNSTVSFDKKRAKNGEKDYVAGTLFNPKNGLHTLLLAEYFFPDVMGLIQKLSGSTEAYSNWQLVLNKVRKG